MQFHSSSTWNQASFCTFNMMEKLTKHVVWLLLVHASNWKLHKSELHTYISTNVIYSLQAQTKSANVKPQVYRLRAREEYNVIFHHCNYDKIKTTIQRFPAITTLWSVNSSSAHSGSSLLYCHTVPWNHIPCWTTYSSWYHASYLCYRKLMETPYTLSQWVHQLWQRMKKTCEQGTPTITWYHFESYHHFFSYRRSTTTSQLTKSAELCIHVTWIEYHIHTVQLEILVDKKFGELAKNRFWRLKFWRMNSPADEHAHIN